MAGRPIATAMLVVDAGAVAEPAGREGVALLTARMLGEGTTRRSGYDFAVAAERVGASWSAEADYDSMRVGFDVPSAELPTAIDLLAEAVRDPAFDETAWTRVSAERIDELAVEWSQPGPRAAAAFAASLWSPRSRYSRRDGGDQQSVAAIGRDDVVGFHRRRLRPDTSTLVLAGDLTGVDVTELAERMFGGWTSAGSASESTADPAAAEAGGRRVFLVDRPGSVQSMLLIGHQGLPRHTPDYVPVTTLALAVAGMFSSRLNYRLREEKGYTYGAFGGFEMRRDGGVFAVRAAVQREVTGPAIADALEVLAGVHTGGISADELEQAKSYRVGVFPVSFAQPHAVAGALADLVVHGLPDDYFDSVRRDVATLDLEPVNLAATQRLQPDQLVTVVVGDAAVVSAELDEFGPMTTVSD
jgi:predicted Zn-dependent peptidase